MIIDEEQNTQSILIDAMLRIRGRLQIRRLNLVWSSWIDATPSSAVRPFRVDAMLHFGAVFGSSAAVIDSVFPTWCYASLQGPSLDPPFQVGPSWIDAMLCFGAVFGSSVFPSWCYYAFLRRRLRQFGLPELMLCFASGAVCGSAAVFILFRCDL